MFTTHNVCNWRIRATGVLESDRRKKIYELYAKKINRKTFDGVRQDIDKYNNKPKNNKNIKNNIEKPRNKTSVPLEQELYILWQQ
ncbi:hypothetical protein J2Z76_001443 [Sedimentibacter acidaminivorans]|uniref:Uncharacterized protein n=1 Tax=Sedimentibacter acidaminivorans TaxID=913099 RepID=A0ABS4GD65_9FIRM|nr:hypothetical protein [Sedimentibacter acidaminivorans]MBP1925584.1 hypothetical protein [Sedimentibacter acidaminivorans]